MPTAAALRLAIALSGLSLLSGATPEPCPQVEGMACIPAGTFIRGSDGVAAERPESEVWLDTFYLDLREVTNAEYQRCVDAKKCNPPKRTFKAYSGEHQPAVAMQWFDAVAYCELQGKRLPTEAEWEKAARGEKGLKFPWGNERPTCKRAVIKENDKEGCGRDTTFDVGSKPAGAYGLFDMAGNVHEWVQDWESECYRGCKGECGDACFGKNPKGPCGGAAECPGKAKRGVRGGSWHWDWIASRSAIRRFEPPANPNPHRFGFRCAKSP